MEDQTFHQSFSKVIAVSQLFALLPVSNILSPNVANVSYSWCSLHTLYSGIIVTLNLLEFASVINLVVKEGLNFHTSGTLSLFVVCILEHIYFWRLAIRWPYIIQLWRHTEEVFLRPPYRIYSTYNMKLRIYGLTFVVLLFALKCVHFIYFYQLVEHTVLMYNSANTSYLELTQCNLSISFWEILYKRERFHLYLVLPFRIWLLPILEWINLTLAYPRSFTDAFIICLAIGLTTRFRQLYLRIEVAHTKIMPKIFWTEVRHHYLSLKCLLRLLNKEVAYLILLACSNNMSFICFQLFNSFQNIGVDTVAVSVFWFSLLFAIARTLMTLYVAATVNDYSHKILSTLRDVPSKSWCLEIQRFSEQLAVDLTAFSGNDLFFMTRKLMLAMLSTIITYELMVTNVINKGSIRQQTDYCTHFWSDEPAIQEDVEPNELLIDPKSFYDIFW